MATDWLRQAISYPPVLMVLLTRSHPDRVGPSGDHCQTIIPGVVVKDAAMVVENIVGLYRDIPHHGACRGEAGCGSFEQRLGVRAGMIPPSRMPPKSTRYGMREDV